MGDSLFRCQNNQVSIWPGRQSAFWEHTSFFYSLHVAIETELSEDSPFLKKGMQDGESNKVCYGHSHTRRPSHTVFLSFLGPLAIEDSSQATTSSRSHPQTSTCFPSRNVFQALQMLKTHLVPIFIDMSLTPSQVTPTAMPQESLRVSCFLCKIAFSLYYDHRDLVWTPKLPTKGSGTMSSSLLCPNSEWR